MAISPIAPCDGAYGAGPNLVEAPAVQPYAFGAMSAFDVVESNDPHDFNGITYKSPACQAGVAEWVDDCDSGAVLPKPVTDLDRDAVVRGCPFHLITNLSCKTTTLEAMFAEARLIFELGEQRQVEAAVFTRLLVQPDVVVLNATEGIGFLQGVAVLESAIAECYPGRATLHADRGVAAYAAANRYLEKRGAGLFTPLDSKWALYAGSPNVGPDGAPAPDGHAWIWATSDVQLRRSSIDVRPDGTDHILQIGTNVPQVLVERSYVPSRECCAFAFLICLGC